MTFQLFLNTLPVQPCHLVASAYLPTVGGVILTNKHKKKFTLVLTYSG